jgi:DNA-directed RNA polymerase II subunit RPB2
MSNLSEEDIWNVINSWFKEYSLISHHFESFKYFIDNSLDDIVKQYNKVEVYTEVEKNTFLENKNVVKFQHKINFTKIYLTKPYHQENNGTIVSMYPADARLRNLTYESKIYIDLEHNIYGLDKNDLIILNKKFISEKITIGKIPIMVQSSYCILNDVPKLSYASVGECKFDHGGYFIINGSEKVIVSQRRENENHVFLYQNSKTSNFPVVCVIKCRVPNVYGMPHTVYVKYSSKDQCIYVLTQQMGNKDIPLFILFRALGILSDKEILEFIVGDLTNPNNNTLLEELRPSLENLNDIQTQEGALQWIGENSASRKFIKKTDEEQIKHALNIIDRHLYPHLLTKDLKVKALYLGYMTKKLLLGKLGKIILDDKDHMGNNRIITTGPLFAELFTDSFQKLCETIKYGIVKETKNKILKDDDLQDLLTRIIKPTHIHSKFRTALSTGNWNLKNESPDSTKMGIAQVLQRFTQVQTISHLRRIITPFNKELKMAKIRLLNGTQCGYLCPCESPEGANVGLQTNMSILTRISNFSNDTTIYLILQNQNIIDIENLNPKEVNYFCKVIINGKWIGVHKEPLKLKNSLLLNRRTGKINFDVSIIYDIENNEIRIYSDAGRILRPLFIVKNNKLLITTEIIKDLKDNKIDFNNLLTGHYLKGKEAVVEFVDPQESEGLLIATSHQVLEKSDTVLYTHSEIHPCTLLGFSASTIPFCNHNQAPRNVFQCAQVKQAMGIMGTNYLSRFDKSSHALYYPQKPAVNTKTMKYFNYNELPAGLNAIVAIASYGGFNQEDSIIFNQSSIERGLFRSTYYDIAKDDLSKGDKRYEKPDPANTTGIKPNASYEHLDDTTGIVKEGTRVEKDDIIIGKRSKVDKSQQTYGGILYRDESISLKDKFKDKSAVVDKVIQSQNGEGYPIVKIKLRKERIPKIGDKFASRHGQKGTIGTTLKEEDMPFTSDGIRPDLIINPHAIPSRMTIGQIFECVLGKATTIEGIECDGSPFSNITLEEISDKLFSHGYEHRGNEVLYNGMTGEQLNYDIFMGPTYYQRLKHMVDDKIHSRARGPVQLLTKQPLEGRSRDGGLRFGEMERDCMLAHGTSNFLKERLFDSSDPYKIHVCDKCGLFAIANKNLNIYECRSCKNNTNISEINIPFSMKLFIQEIMSMSIAPRIITESYDI